MECKNVLNYIIIAKIAVIPKFIL